MGWFSKDANPDRLPLRFGLEAGALGLTVDRDAHTVHELGKSPVVSIAGASAEVMQGSDLHRRFTVTRIIAGGVIFGLRKKQEGTVFLTVTAADGSAAVVLPLKVKREAAARKFAAEFNAVATRLAAQVDAPVLMPSDKV